MSLSDNIAKYAVLTVVGLGAGVLLWQAFEPGSTADGRMADVTVPQLSDRATEGKVAFDAVCATCHGANAAGSDKGPPLVHDIYNPGHHSDDAFLLAAQRGVRQHHWRFGNMPPQPQISETEIRDIVQYVRELQLANGITYKQHRM
ncbi:cytochrome c [Pelagibius sp. CAU 1746]|uniref:c-type cytochrome n=1 Tax=Pelagibius sp. CAU 1746 TaxID=3140370 RepID=UPI00325C0448